MTFTAAARARSRNRIIQRPALALGQGILFTLLAMIGNHSRQLAQIHPDAATILALLDDDIAYFSRG
jgi:hypothetical protein